MTFAGSEKLPGGSKLDRVELYRLLADASRLRALALCAEEEVSVGELALLLDESQPQVSRKVAPLRKVGLLSARRDGARTWLRLGKPTSGPSVDRLVADAVDEGRRLCTGDGSLSRLAEVVVAREEQGMEHFEKEPQPSAPAAQPTASPDVLAHLVAIGPILPGRSLAVDVGTGEGSLLDVLAPLYERVLAVERSRARLARCARNISERGYRNVSLFPGSYDDPLLMERVHGEGGADLVFASRMLHHTSRPKQALEVFARLLKKGGHLVVLDFAAHHDEAMREAQGDVWLGFDGAEIANHFASAGLSPVTEVQVPAAFHRAGEGAHLDWRAWVARKPSNVSVH